MATEVNLPELGESVTEGTVTRWLKQVGDEVAVDEPLLEVSTDKVDTEIPSPVAGTLLEIKAQEDETVEVGAALAVIGAADESSGDAGSAGDDRRGRGERAGRRGHGELRRPRASDQDRLVVAVLEDHVLVLQRLERALLGRLLGDRAAGERRRCVRGIGRREHPEHLVAGLRERQDPVALAHR